MIETLLWCFHGYIEHISYVFLVLLLLALNNKKLAGLLLYG